MIFLTYNFQVEYFLFVHAIDYGFTRIFTLIVHLKASKHQISTPTVGTFLHMDSAKKVSQIMVVYYCFFWSTSILISMTAQCTITIRLKIVVENVNLDIYFFDRTCWLACEWRKIRHILGMKFSKNDGSYTKGFMLTFDVKYNF